MLQCIECLLQWWKLLFTVMLYVVQHMSLLYFRCLNLQVTEIRFGVVNKKTLWLRTEAVN